MAKAKVTSRHQALVKMGGQVSTIAGAVKGLAETLQKEDAARVKRFEQIETAADEAAAAFRELRVVMEDLKAEVGFNAQPFWRRWRQTWRDSRERLKNAHRTVALMPQPADYPMEAEKVVAGLASEIDAASGDLAKGSDGPQIRADAPPEQPTPAEGSLVADKGGPSATLLPDSPDKRGSEGAGEEAPPDSDGLSDEAGAKSDKPGGSGPMVDGPSEETGGSVTSAAAPNDSDGLPDEEGGESDKFTRPDPQVKRVWPRSTEGEH